MKFTVLMPVHNAIELSIFRKSVNSVINNILPPSEFLIIIDGKISYQKKIFLFQEKKKNKFMNVIFKKKSGLVKILNFGLKKAKYNLVARADADDFNHKNRFLEQVNFFKKNKVDILGSYIDETIGRKKFIKRVPANPNLLHFCFINPVNHNTVMFYRDKIIKLGSYPGIKYKEDYALWFSAKLAGYTVKNLNIPLVNSVFDVKKIKRRKNLRAIYLELDLFFFILKKNILLIFILPFSFLLRIIFLMLPAPIFLSFLKKINRLKN